MKSFFIFAQHKNTTIVSILFLSTVILFAVLIPFLSPYSDDLRGAVHLEINNQAPSLSHFFGTDAAGRDMFTLTLRGGLVSIRVAISVVFMSIALGVPLGLVAGVSEKRVDEVIMRICDAFLSFPPLVLPIVIAVALGGSLNSVIVGISISWFPWYVRIARAQAITIKSSDYVLISKSMGGSLFHIVTKHILPNSISPVIVQGSIDAGYAILTVAGLSFIGLGAEPPLPEWGLLITASRAQFLYHWWVVVFPGVFILLTVLCFNIIGDDLRDYLNPKIENN
ncbi:MAG: ABC transporter permease [Candidatus Neomarinimicrobiota bacterium]|nr:MAG: ABC transporter permease [bacterium]|tara:strand:- start:3026 stop:3868 length:843 start_codon:yes stop_codon:yes gene_type:complete